MQIVVSDLLTNYEIAGTGQTVLFVHGWGDSLKTFNELSSSLSGDYRAVRLDLPGFGSTQAPQQVWGLDEYALFVKKFLEKLEINKIDLIIAHSNGGALAICGLANGTLKSKKLVLLSSSGIRNTEKTRRLLLKVVAKAGKLATFWLPESQRQKLRKKLYGVSGSDMLVAPHLQETFKRTVHQDVQADAAKLTIPTLLIYGDSDKATPPEFGMRFNNLIKGSRLEILAGSEHFVHHDASDAVIKLIRDFIN